jgi:hypothetical protein
VRTTFVTAVGGDQVEGLSTQCQRRRCVTTLLTPLAGSTGTSTSELLTLLEFLFPDSLTRTPASGASCIKMLRASVLLSLLELSSKLLGAEAVVICNKTLFCDHDGRPTHAHLPAVAGLLLNSRMIQGVFDDTNSTTRALWAYPDGSPYSEDRQTDELASNLSSYAACGLDAITVGMQGGGPFPDFPPHQPNNSSGFEVDGTPRAAWLSRLGKLLDAAASANVTMIVSLFYQGQVERINGDSAVAMGVDAMVDWLLARGEGGSGRVLLEIANEVGCNSFPPSIQPDTVHALIERAKARSGGALLVSASFLGAAVPPDTAIAAADYVTIHCNGESPAQVAAQVSAVQMSAAFQAAPKPIVFNECSTDLSVMDAAINSHASWGFYSQGERGYTAGFQTPPTNWKTTSSNVTAAFFAHVAKLTENEATCDAA